MLPVSEQLIVNVVNFGPPILNAHFPSPLHLASGCQKENQPRPFFRVVAGSLRNLMALTVNSSHYRPLQRTPSFFGPPSPAWRSAVRKAEIIKPSAGTAHYR